MGIFEDEARKMAVESAKRLRDADQWKAESSQVAGRVAEDLLKYIASEPGAEDFDVGVDERRITVRGQKSGRELKIDVSGSGTGGIFEVKGDSGAVTAVDQSQMARRVIEWLQQSPETTELAVVFASTAPSSPSSAQQAHALPADCGQHPS